MKKAYHCIFDPKHDSVNAHIDELVIEGDN